MYSTRKVQTPSHNRSLHLYRAGLIVSNCNMLENQQEKKALIMHRDVISCVIFMSDRVEYLKKEILTRMLY